MADLEMSLINFVKELSIEDQRKDPSSTFRQISIPVKTLPNNGSVKLSKRTFSNACFFISLRDGLYDNKITQFKYKGFNIKPTPFNLMIASEYTDFNKCFDTNKDSHVNSLNKLIKYFDNINIQFYIGSYDRGDGTWKTVPDLMTPSYGNGPINIRILNKGAHFEYITTPDENFIYKPRTMTLDKVRTQQESLLNSYQ